MSNILEKHEYQRREKVVNRLTKAVKKLTPSVLNSNIMRNHILAAYETVYTAVVTGIMYDCDRGGFEIEYATLNNAITIKELYRTLLINPLPSKRVIMHFKGKGLDAPLDVQIADEIFWGEQLNDSQKETIIEILGLDLITGEKYVPAKVNKNERHIIHQSFTPEPVFVSAQTIQIESEGSAFKIDIPEILAIPLLVWSPDHGVVVTFCPIEEKMDGEVDEFIN